MEEKISEPKKYCPIWCLCLYILAIVCVIINIISVCSAAFSDAFNGTIAAFFRTVLAKLTGWLPFSLGETIVLCVPIFSVLIIVKAVRLSRNDLKAAIRFLCGLLAVCTLFYSLFVLTFATAYRGSSLDVKLDLEKKDVSADELNELAVYLLNKSNELAEEVAFSEEGCSKMEYSISELNDKLNEAYALACDKYNFIQNLNSNVKNIAMSDLLSYTHITGIYTYYTGEANINYIFPDYTLPYTMAHEMAHQRGIAREDEANFVAFLVCIESDDPYILYSAYLNMYEYVASALRSADAEAYSELVALKGVKIISEHTAYSDFFDKYRDSVASDVADTVNDTYLNIQGQTSGTKSYGLVVDLAVAYFKNISVI